MLRFGVTLAAVLVAIGGLLSLLHPRQAEPNYRHFHANAALSSIASIVHGAVHLDPQSIIQLGLLLLIDVYKRQLLQLADWFDTPVIRAQRLSDDPTDHTVHSYYHWREQNVDFITLDNASAEMFDPAQMKWIQDLIKMCIRDRRSPA